MVVGCWRAGERVLVTGGGRQNRNHWKLSGGGKVEMLRYGRI